MRNYLALLLLSALISACGGGGGSAGSGVDPTGSTIPVGSVSGVTFDGLISQANVNIYDFTIGAKGALLEHAVSDSAGKYSISLQVESRPILVEITGGSYVEEAGSNATIALGPDHKLTAVVNYVTGATIKTAVTTFTHLAAGLAAYEISKGTAVATAISDANDRITALVGFNIIATSPLVITDPGSAKLTLTPELQYGFLAGAISTWTNAHAPRADLTHVVPYTSIDFAQLMYQDISADGLLDGMGLDSANEPAPLSFGTTPLGVDVYRLGIGTGIVQMAANANNKTGLNGAKVLSFAESYIANTDALFNAVPVVAFAPQSVAITSPSNNAWTRRTINVSASASSPFGLQSAELLIDGVSVATSVNSSTTPSFSVDTTTLSEALHTLTVRTTDVGGGLTSSTIPVKVDNTPPTTLTMNNYVCTVGYSLFCAGQNITASGTATDTYSGVAGAVVTGFSYNGIIGGTPLYPTAVPVTSLVNANGTWALTPITNFYGMPVRIYDIAGNCSDYRTQTMTEWVNGGTAYVQLILVTANACP